MGDWALGYKLEKFFILKGKTIMQTYTGIFFFITLLIYHGSETVLDFILYMLIPLAIYCVLYIYNKLYNVL